MQDDNFPGTYGKKSCLMYMHKHTSQYTSKHIDLFFWKYSFGMSITPTTDESLEMPCIYWNKIKITIFENYNAITQRLLCFFCSIEICAICKLSIYKIEYMLFPHTALLWWYGSLSWVFDYFNNLLVWQVWLCRTMNGCRFFSDLITAKVAFLTILYPNF